MPLEREQERTLLVALASALSKATAAVLELGEAVERATIAIEGFELPELPTTDAENPVQAAATVLSIHTPLETCRVCGAEIVELPGQDCFCPVCAEREANI